MPSNNFMEPEFSIIMNCHNSDQYLSEAIDSVYAQSYEKWEIIFYDNASTDGSSEIAKTYDDRLKYIYNKEKLPLGAARNAAINHTSGQYIAFLDCDDLWHPQKLELQREALRSKASQGRNIGLCYSDSMRIDSMGKDLMLFSHEKNLLSGSIYSALIQDCFIDMSTCVVLKSAMREVGGFDDKYEFVEDWDTWLKVAESYDVALIDEPMVKTRLHQGNVSADVIEHCREMILLISSIKSNDQRVIKARDNSIKKILMRQSILLFVQSLRNRQGVIMAMMRLVLMIIKSPLTAFRVLVRNLNLGMFKLFRIRVLGEG